MLTHPAMGKTLRARALRGPHHVLQPRPRVQLVYGPRVRVPRGLSRRHGRRRWWLRMQLIYWLKVACGAFSGVGRGDPVGGGLRGPGKKAWFSPPYQLRWAKLLALLSLTVAPAIADVLPDDRADVLYLIYTGGGITIQG